MTIQAIGVKQTRAGMTIDVASQNVCSFLEPKPKTAKYSRRVTPGTRQALDRHWLLSCPAHRTKGVETFCTTYDISADNFGATTRPRIQVKLEAAQDKWRVELLRLTSLR